MPYNMLSTRLFKHVMTISHGVLDDYYDLHDHVMYPFTAQQERKTQRDYGTKRGCHSTSSSSAFGQLSSSHLNDDDDDGNDEGPSVQSLLPPLVFDEYDTTIPSLITKSSSPSPLNAPSKTLSTKDTSSTFGTTSSSFESKPQSSPSSSNDSPSPQPSNNFIDNIMDAPPRPSKPIPL
ncbi:hypothetical protein Tco_1500328 [Tanacetum coccineum]